MRILVSGATGLIGSSLVPYLENEGHHVTALVRSGDGGVIWDPSTGVKDPAAVEGCDVVVHLAGESIAAGRWSPERKKRIRESRVTGTRSLVASLGSLAKPPHVLVCASAIGYYGDRGDEFLDEESSSGRGFLPEVCVAWEKAAAAAARIGVRVVSLRFGVILSARGGALAKMLLPFRLGLGGRVGSGRQYMSWVPMDDVVRIVDHVLRRDEISGPVNCVAPGPVTNAKFTSALARALSRPAIFPLPAFAARLAFGEMADELLLSSARVVPRRLEESGYRFLHSDLPGALRDVLRAGRSPGRTAA
ncbi:MAG TPA: TIGR01777 family oxidoreductase [Candidatus Saccharimonadales bacterium]|nr:TIGR01777 family oxidoreductase [Candidatus Saccharimonadales bacterium]